MATIPTDFAFDRYGVRVPAVIASPYIRPGTILRPSDNYPEDGATPFDHASVINTLRHRFELGDPLTARVEAAPTLERVLNLDAPENLGPETIAASDCNVGPLYKFNSLLEIVERFTGEPARHGAQIADRLTMAAPKSSSTVMSRSPTRTSPTE